MNELHLEILNFFLNFLGSKPEAKLFRPKESTEENPIEPIILIDDLFGIRKGKLLFGGAFIDTIAPVYHLGIVVTKDAGNTKIKTVFSDEYFLNVALKTAMLLLHKQATVAWDKEFKTVQYFNFTHDERNESVEAFSNGMSAAEQSEVVNNPYAKDTNSYYRWLDGYQHRKMYLEKE